MPYVVLVISNDGKRYKSEELSLDFEGCIVVLIPLSEQR